MAQAAFFVDELTITEKDKFLVIEGVRRCPHGHTVEQVFLTVPIKLKHLFAEIHRGGELSKADRSETDSAAVAERLRKYFESN